MDPVLTPRSSGEGRFQQRTLSAKQEGLAICFSQARSQDSLKLLHCVDYSHFTETTSVILDSPSNEKLAKSPSPLSPPLRKGGSISPAWSSMSTGALPGSEEKSPQFSSTGGVVCVCVFTLQVHHSGCTPLHSCLFIAPSRDSRSKMKCICVSATELPQAKHSFGKLLFN